MVLNIYIIFVNCFLSFFFKEQMTDENKNQKTYNIKYKNKLGREDRIPWLYVISNNSSLFTLSNSISNAINWVCSVCFHNFKDFA